MMLYCLKNLIPEKIEALQISGIAACIKKNSSDQSIMLKTLLSKLALLR